MSNLFNQVNTTKAVEDHSVATVGFERKPLAEGMALARFVGYVEVGEHVEQFQGQDKAPAMQSWMTFELHGRHAEERTDDKGNKTVFNPTLTVKLPKSLNSKAKFFKLFKKMSAGRDDIKMMPQMLGEAFILKITNNASSKDPKKIYSNIYVDGEWHVSPPVILDPLTNESKPVPVPPMTDKNQQLLLWGDPTIEQWNSIFIDGTYERKKGDEVVQVSKNFIQETCLKAVDFAGSPLAALLEGEGLGDIIDDIQAGASAEDDTPDVIEDETPAEEAAPEETPEEELPEPPAEETVDEKSEEDMLKELGLA